MSKEHEARLYIDFAPYMQARGMTIAEVFRSVNEGRPKAKRFNHARVYRVLTGRAKNIDSELALVLMRLFDIEIPDPFVEISNN